MIKLFKKWRKRVDAERQLQRMTDHQLKDLGITRGTIHEAVWSK